MKNWPVYDWVLFMLGAAIAIDLIVCVAMPAIFKIPTTEENKEVRKELLGMLNNISIAIIAILALKYKESLNDKL